MMDTTSIDIQEFYYFSVSDAQWKSAYTSTQVEDDPSSSLHDSSVAAESPQLYVRLTTWNIDFQTDHAEQRMEKALSYLAQLHQEGASNIEQAGLEEGQESSDTGRRDSRSIPSVILLQEMTPSDLEVIRRTKWVQGRFYITDLVGEFWAGFGTYGTTTLIDRRLRVQKVFRAHYRSMMGRDALFTDIEIANPTTATNVITTTAHSDSETLQEDTMMAITTSKKRFLRVCNTHLESLGSGVKRRPVQLKLASEFMYGLRSSPEIPAEVDKSPDAKTHQGLDVTDPLADLSSASLSGDQQRPFAAILAGDLNAFAPEDAVAPAACGLQDAYLVLGGKEGSDDGFTWGMHSERERKQFGYSRMDKVLFCGDLEVMGLKRIGAGVKAKINKDGQDNKVWVTDHLGLQAVFKVKET